MNSRVKMLLEEIAEYHEMVTGEDYVVSLVENEMIVGNEFVKYGVFMEGAKLKISLDAAKKEMKKIFSKIAKNKYVKPIVNFMKTIWNKYLVKIIKYAMSGIAAVVVTAYIWRFIKYITNKKDILASMEKTSKSTILALWNDIKMTTLALFNDIKSTKIGTKVYNICVEAIKYIKDKYNAIKKMLSDLYNKYTKKEKEAKPKNNAKKEKK